jgi:uroporphyrinogen decarboxylase
LILKYMSQTVQSPKTSDPADRGHDAGGLTNRQRFLNACRCRPVDHPPVWLMRQAGRALPEYRALKEKHTFLELVQTPELAAEVTLQPIRRFGFDAAILFSDILVVCEGLGQRYQFRDRGGIEMEFLLKSAADIDRLEVEAVTERLQYVAKALPLIKTALGGRTALIGFAGSPWTLANFMVEGGGVKEYTKAKALFYSDPPLFARLLEKLTKAVSGFLQLQIDAGADAVQIFDSLGGVLSDGDFAAASGRWMKQIVGSLKASTRDSARVASVDPSEGTDPSPRPSTLPRGRGGTAGSAAAQAGSGQAPVIVFSKGTHGNWDELVATGAQVLGMDWNVRLADVRARLPDRVGVQGNLDPFLLSTTPEAVAAGTNRILREMRGRPGHVFNLGHGVPPSAKLENIESLVTVVRNFKCRES